VSVNHNDVTTGVPEAVAIVASCKIMDPVESGQPGLPVNSWHLAVLVLALLSRSGCRGMMLLTAS